jgi:hypothetical protein
MYRGNTKFKSSFWTFARNEKVSWCESYYKLLFHSYRSLFNVTQRCVHATIHCNPSKTVCGVQVKTPRHDCTNYCIFDYYWSQPVESQQITEAGYRHVYYNNTCPMIVWNSSLYSLQHSSTTGRRNLSLGVPTPLLVHTVSPLVYYSWIW